MAIALAASQGRQACVVAFRGENVGENPTQRTIVGKWSKASFVHRKGRRRGANGDNKANAVSEMESEAGRTCGV